MMAIEGTVFVLMIASYFYLHSRSVEWPPHRNPPDLFWGTLNLGIFLVSVIPNEWYRRRARKGDLRAVQIGLVRCRCSASPMWWCATSSCGT